MTALCAGFRRLPLVALIAAGSLGTGCVRRTVTIRTAPEGATVILNDDEVGTSPVTVPFTWYGDYDVILRMDGYKTLHTHHRVSRPWYQYPPIDLIAEAFVPFTIHDEHQAFFELEPAEAIARDDLLERAYELRDRALFGED